MDSVVVINNNNEKKYIISYEKIRSQKAYDFSSFLHWIYQNKDDFTLYCSCNKEAKMHFKMRKGKIIVATNPKLLFQHKEGCLFRENLKDHQLKGTHYRALQIVAPDHIRLTVNHLGIVETTKNQKRKSSKNSSTKSYTRSYMTIGGLGKELLSRAWEYAMDNYVQGKYPYPSIKGLRYALKELFVGNISKKDSIPPKIKVEISKGHFLYDKLLLGSKNDGAIAFHKNKENINPVVLIPFTKSYFEQDYDEDHHLLKIPTLYKEDEHTEFVIRKEEWNEITKTNRTRVNFNKHNQYFLIGLCEANKYGKPPIIFKAELIATTIRGMFIESSYENQLFSIMEKERRDYVRPNQVMEELDNLKPDAFLRDTGKPCIIEIFGINESNKEYHRSREKKIAFYQSLEQYMFYKWDAYTGKKPEKLPSKLKRG